MPKTVQRYLCDVCGLEHKEFHYAVECESLPKKDIDVAIGEVVEFEDEIFMFSSRYAYETNSGTVLFKYYVVGCDNETGDKAHIQVLVVTTKYIEIEMEVMLTVQDGCSRLFSPVERKFKKGYSENLKAFIHRGYSENLKTFILDRK